MGNTSVRQGSPVLQTAGHDPAEPVPEVHLSTANSKFSGHSHQVPGDDGDAGGISHAGSSESMGHSPPESPGSAARSPLMFTPQVPVVPIAKADEVGPCPYPPWTHNSQSYEKQHQERGIPTLIQWSHGGNEVFVEGSWDDWSNRIPLQKAGKDFTLVKVLPSGVYQYKFVVNNEWRYAPDLPWMYDETGNVINVLDVQDYVPENLESVSGFEPPRSPDASYSEPFPGPEDLSKEPPVVPPHLHLTLLNMPPHVDTPGTLLRPPHVILNHLYVEKGKAGRSVLAFGLTHRFRSKYVTVVLYKPLRR